MAQNTERQAWMSVLSTAEPAALRTCFAELGDRPGFTWLRAPEFGAVMVRGRAGGTGSAFNLGEMTVTRCTLRLDTGEVGHAYLPGREAAAAEAAALCDALMQSDRAQDVRARVITPLAEARAARHARTARQAEATRVDFFTMVRGEG